MAKNQAYVNEYSPFLQEYLKDFQNKTQLFNIPVDTPSQTPDEYLYKGDETLFLKNTRKILRNELCIEFDFTEFAKNDDNEYKKAKLFAKEQIEKIKNYLIELDYSFHMTDHQGKSPYIRLRIPGLEYQTENIANQYKINLRNKIIKNVQNPYPEHILIDDGLHSENIGVPLEGSKHRTYDTVVKIVEQHQGSKTVEPDIIKRLYEKNILNDSTKSNQIDKLEVADIKIEMLSEFFQKNFESPRRNKLTMALAGILHQRGISYNDACSILRKVWKVHMDDVPIEQRFNEMKSTFEKDISEVGVWSYLVQAFEENSNEITSFYNCFPKKVHIENEFSLNEFIKLDIPKVDWFIKDILPNTGITFMGGKPGRGKSILAIHMAFHIAAGIPWLGKFQTKKAKVLYIDEDNSLHSLHHHFGIIARGLKEFTTEDIENFTVVTDLGIKIDDMNDTRIEKLVVKHRPDLVILDSYVRFMNGDQNDNKEIARTYDVIKKIMAKYKCAFFSLHHVAKSNDQLLNVTSMEALRGGGDIAGQASGVLMMEKESPTDNVFHFGQGKNRFAPSISPFKLRLENGEDNSVNFVYNGSLLGKKQAEVQDALFMIYEHVMNTGNEIFTRKDFIEVCSLTDAKAKTILKKLEDNEKIMKPSFGKYKLIIGVEEMELENI